MLPERKVPDSSSLTAPDVVVLGLFFQRKLLKGDLLRLRSFLRAPISSARDTNGHIITQIIKRGGRNKCREFKNREKTAIFKKIKTIFFQNFKNMNI